MMQYPTLEQVERADRLQLCRWWRHLNSPGAWAIGRDNFEAVKEQEVAVMDRIAERFKEVGGFTPEISKHIGW
jgi:hypothetical protein